MFMCLVQERSFARLGGMRYTCMMYAVARFCAVRRVCFCCMLTLLTGHPLKRFMLRYGEAVLVCRSRICKIVDQLMNIRVSTDTKCQKTTTSNPALGM